jgi:hypothetical protein
MKEFEDDDPMELEAVVIPDGDLEEQARFMMEEFLGMGMPKEDVLDLFRNPFYLGTHRLYRMLGEEKIRRLSQDGPIGSTAQP